MTAVPPEGTTGPRRRELLGLGVAAVAGAAWTPTSWGPPPSEEVEPPLRRTPQRRAARPKAKLRAKKKRGLAIGSLVPTPFAVLVHRRLGLGHRPGDLAAFDALGGDDAARLARYLDRELDLRAPSAVDLGRLAATADDGRRFALENLARRVYGRRPLFEAVVAFWHGYFGGAEDTRRMRARDAAIREHALGNAGDLLRAVGAVGPSEDLDVGEDLVPRLAAALAGSVPDSAIAAGLGAYAAAAGSGDQIAATIRAMATSPGFFSEAGPTPRPAAHVAVAALRALGCGPEHFSNPQVAEFLLDGIETLGGTVPSAFAAAGPMSRARVWSFLARLTRFASQNGRRPFDPVSLTPSAHRTSAAFTDHWIGELLGKSLEPLRRQALVEVLSAGRAEGRRLDLSEVGVGDRVRSMVSLVLMSPEFLAR